MLDRNIQPTNRWRTTALVCTAALARATAVALTLGWLAISAAAVADDEQQAATDSKPETTAETAARAAESSAAGPAAPADPTASAKPLSTPPLADVRAYRDPVTGEITTLPRPEQFDQLDAATAEAMSRSTEGLEVFPLRSGGVGVHLKGRFRNALIAHRHPDGTFSASCVDHPEHAQEILEGPAPVTEADPLEEM